MQFPYQNAVSLPNDKSNKLVELFFYHEHYGFFIVPLRGTIMVKLRDAFFYVFYELFAVCFSIIFLIHNVWANHVFEGKNNC